MHRLHRSAKHLLLIRSYRSPFTSLAELGCLLEEEPAQKNIIHKFTRFISVLAEDHVHETSRRNQQDRHFMIDGDVSLSQRMHRVIAEERRCKGEGLEHGSLELGGGVTTVTRVGDTHVDDSVSTCVLGSPKGYEKGNFCNEAISELEAGTISNASDLVKSNFLSKQNKGNKHFDGSLSENAVINPCEAYCEYINKEKHFDSSMREHASETMKFPSRGKQRHIVNDSTSEFSELNINSKSGNHTGESMGKERLKLSVDNTETGLQIEVCVSDTKTSRNENVQERTCSQICGFLKGVSTSEKVHSFTTEQGLVSQSCERGYCALQKKINKKKKKKKKKKNKTKKQSWNTNRQFRPEDLEHLSITPHPFRIAAAGQALFKEKQNIKDARTCLPNFSLIQSKVISPVACRKSPGYIDSFDSVSRDALKLNDKEKRVSVDAIKHMTSVELSNEGEGEVKHQSWEVELTNPKLMTGKIWRLWEKGPSSWQEHGHRPLLLTEKEQAHLNALSYNEVIDKGAENEASGYFLGNKGKTIAYNQIKDGTSLDPSSNFWERVRTIAPVETCECGVEKARWELASVRKDHYPYRDLFIILDLNGVLIKRWDKNPSLPGVSKLNKKWIQLRPGCIEFLQKAFSSFRVGIWSTVTQKNVLSMCNFLEQQAHQNLPFFMLWSKDSCYQHRGVQRPNKANVVADFKPLSRVWGYFKPYLGFHNTVLVDDSPYKACMNNPYNCVFPDTFEGYTDDKYLNDVLWPYLDKMRMSHNIQAYIANNPLGQPPVVVGHKLYHHVHQVMDVFKYCVSPPTRAP